MHSTQSLIGLLVALAAGGYAAWRIARVNDWNGWQFVTCLLIVEGALAVIFQTARHWH